MTEHRKRRGPTERGNLRGVRTKASNAGKKRKCIVVSFKQEPEEVASWAGRICRISIAGISGLDTSRRGGERQEIARMRREGGGSYSDGESPNMDTEY